jgi:hypothetical protein
LVLGAISTFTLPAIGYFDEHNYSTIHGISATLFFLSVGVYAWMLGGIMQDNMDKFPESQWPEIRLLNKIKYVMWGCLLTFLITICFFNDSGLVPLSEWLSTLLFVNYFAVLSFTNQYYDSVHSYNTSMTMKQTPD